MRRTPPLLPSQLALLLLPLLLLFAAPAHAERKVALVIGNGAYRHVSPLTNPANDARLMAESLKAIGFELVGGHALTDVATKDALDKAVRTFGEMIRGGGVGLFFYAGHGVQVDGKNYLIPVGADVTSRAQIKYELVDADYVLDEMNESSTKVNLVILDACRNNPFAGRGLRAVTPGLATVLAPRGTLIAYSTAPGKTASDGNGKNSPFTTALARQLRIPGQRIEDVFINVGVEVEKNTGGEQSPWQSNSLRGVFCLAGTCGQQAASLAPSAPVAAATPPAAPVPALAAPSVHPKTAPAPTPDEAKLMQALRLAWSVKHDAERTRAHRLAIPLAAKGSIYGKYALGWLSEDEKAQQQALQQGARQGIPLAMVELAEYLVDNPVSPADETEARAWLQKALELGEPKAKVFLGSLLVQGKGGPRDVAAGERLLAEVTRELPEYNLLVGVTYSILADKGLPKAEATAKFLAYARRGADLGDTHAMMQMGFEYETGESVPKNLQEAVWWFTKAAEKGDLYAMTLLGITLRGRDDVPADPITAARWLRKASELGDDAATINLAQMAIAGEGVQKDVQRGLGILKELSENGSGFAQTELAKIYRYGLGVPKNQAEAYFWLVVADSAGDIGGRVYRASLAKEIPAEQRASIEARAAKWRPKKTAR